MRVNETRLAPFLDRVRSDPEVLAAILFGSQARGEAASDSDMDLCIVLKGNKREPLELSQKRLDYLSAFELDIHVFQQLPIWIRARLLKEGKVLFVRDEDALYDLAYRTIQAWEDFRPHYRAYLDVVARG